jgi:hypothetical protein
LDQDWLNFLNRLKRRLIRVLDVLSVMVFDGVILGIGYALVRVAETLTGSGSGFFEAARKISSGVFLLLYVTWVGFDIWDFLKDSYKG